MLPSQFQNQIHLKQREKNRFFTHSLQQVVWKNPKELLLVAPQLPSIWHPLDGAGTTCGHHMPWI